jgi:hypothetical protein
LADKKRREEEEAAALAYKDFIEAFDGDTPSGGGPMSSAIRNKGKGFVKGGTQGTEKYEPTTSNSRGGYVGISGGMKKKSLMGFEDEDDLDEVCSVVSVFVHSLNHIFKPPPPPKREPPRQPVADRQRERDRERDEPPPSSSGPRPKRAMDSFLEELKKYVT